MRHLEAAGHFKAPHWKSEKAGIFFASISTSRVFFTLVTHWFWAIQRGCNSIYYKARGPPGSSKCDITSTGNPTQDTSLIKPYKSSPHNSLRYNFPKVFLYQKSRVPTKSEQEIRPCFLHPPATGQGAMHYFQMAGRASHAIRLAQEIWHPSSWSNAPGY